MTAFVQVREPPPGRRARCTGGMERHLTEAAVMVAFATHLLDAGASLVELHPDGEHGKRYDIRGALEARGFEFVSGKGTRDAALLHILFFTGCRITEVTHLRVSDLFEDSGYFCLEFTVKGGKRLRVAINHELQLALRRYLARSGHGAERDAPLLLPVQRAQRRKPLDTRQVNKPPF